MRLVQRKQFQYTLLMLCIGIASSAQSSEFFTIIGPDGRPMVVQKNEAKKKPNIQQQLAQQKTTVETVQPTMAKPLVVESVESVAQPNAERRRFNSTSTQSVRQAPSTTVNPVQHRIQMQPTAPVNTSVSAVKSDTPRQVTHGDEEATVAPAKATASKAAPIKETPIKPSAHAVAVARSVQVQQSTDSPTVVQTALPKKLNPQLIPEKLLSKQPQQKNRADEQPREEQKAVVVEKLKQQSAPAQPPIPVQPQISTAGHAEQVTSAASTAESTATTTAASNNQAITEVDGEQYIDNEYLEQKEFNLDGRKRFYVMPNSSIGGRNFETVEREKGISKALFSKLSKTAAEKHPPAVLAPTYYRLPQKEVVSTLEQACFSGKKLEKAKTLTDDDEMGIWPVPPIKEKFVYDVVKLDAKVENIQFSSYASSQKKPTYYWPLVVFLDQQGCVIEGVSGFKNQDLAANQLKYSALEGILKKPAQAHYLFMTPLAESIDVPELQLSNRGQIKLHALSE